MKLIAIHEIVRKPKAVQPGEEFEAGEKEAAELLTLGAAREPVVEEPVVEEPVVEEPVVEEPVVEEPVVEEPPKTGRKKKAESEDSVI